MNKKAILLTLLGLTCAPVFAQVRRSFQFSNTALQVFAQNNRLQNNFSFPAMKAFIIIDNTGNSLNEIYVGDELRKLPVNGMDDYACFYYIKADTCLNDVTLKQFLRDFVKWCYESDYIDRNEVHLVFYGQQNKISCTSLYNLNDIVAGVHILSGRENVCNSYGASTVNEIWKHSLSAKTSVKYEVPGMADMEEIENKKLQKVLLQSFYNRKGDIAFQLTAGSHHIRQEYRTTFDTSTLVDFTNFKTLWNLRAAYYFSNRFYSNFDVALIYSGKQKSIDSIDWNNPNGITVSGSGYAGAMLRYGIGLGFAAYNRNRLSINTGVDAGIIHTLAGGGNATRTIGGGNKSTEIVKQKQKSKYYNIYAGLNYRSGRSFFFNGNLQYNLSSLKQPIGSISAFTGISVNFGLGIIISTKNKDE
jgi:hypothetical protein